MNISPSKDKETTGAARVAGIRGGLAALLRKNESYILIFIIVFSVFTTIVNPSFLSLENLFDLIKSGSEMAILALGVFVVLLSGGLDVSFTAVAISGQYIAVNAMILLGIDNIFFAFLVSCAVGVVLGSINAFLIHRFKLPTLITTLGTLNAFHGALLAFVGSRAFNPGQLPECFSRFGLANLFTIVRPDGTMYGLSIYFLFSAGIAVLVWFILRFTLIGRGILALGGNPEAALRSGFNIRKIQFFIYIFVGLLAGIMGIIHVSTIDYSNPNAIIGSELAVIGAVVIGGARITGGSGTITGTILGVIVINLLKKNLILMGVPSYWEQIIVGLIIIAAMSVTYLRIKKRNQERLLFVRES
jgi:simple sugar transport system permease protein